MESGTTAFLKKKIILLIRSSPLLTRLLWQSDDLHLDVDLECQYATLLPNDQRRDYQNPQPISDQPSLPVAAEFASYYNPLDDPETHIMPTDEPTKIAILNDGAKHRLAMLVTEDLVYRTQDVVNDLEKIRKHDRSQHVIIGEVLTIESQIRKIKADLENASEGEEAEELRKEIDQEKARLQDAQARLDRHDLDRNILRTNFADAKDASHDFLLEILRDAGLLQIPPDEPEPGYDYPLNQSGLNDNDSTGSRAESPIQDDEETFRREVYKELGEMSNELQDSERIFNNLENVYEEQADEYEAEMAKGEVWLARSEFDRMFLANNMAATTRLIKAQKAFKAKKRQAKALGIVGSTWGDEMDFGEYEAPSVTSDEMREYQSSRDWSFVENWVESISSVEALHSLEAHPEETEVDDWDARLDDMWDSISAVDHREENRDNFELWDEIRDGKNDDESTTDSSPEYGDDSAVLEQNSEHNDDDSAMEEAQEPDISMLMEEESHRSEGEISPMEE